MAQITAIAATTSAVAYTAAASKPVSTAGYRGITVSADALATTEEVDIYIAIGSTVKALTNVSGTAQKLTASIPALFIEGGPTYIFAKDITASACGVYVDFQNK